MLHYIQILNEIHSAAEMLVFVEPRHVNFTHRVARLRMNTICDFAFRDLPPAEVVDDLAKTWRNRTAVAQYSPKFLEQVLKVRR